MQTIRIVSHYRPRFVRNFYLSCTNIINIAGVQICEMRIILRIYECYVCYFPFSEVYLEYTTPALSNKPD
jgi:hypothetical protein